MQETVEVIVRLPKEAYEQLKKALPYKLNLYENLIKSGTILPKGHGRLFILDEAKAKEYFTNFSFSSQSWISEVDISKATLKVIEADKEAEHDNRSS